MRMTYCTSSRQTMPHTQIVVQKEQYLSVRNLKNHFTTFHTTGVRIGLDHIGFYLI